MAACTHRCASWVLAGTRRRAHCGAPAHDHGRTCLIGSAVPACQTGRRASLCSEGPCLGQGGQQACRPGTARVLSVPGRVVPCLARLTQARPGRPIWPGLASASRPAASADLVSKIIALPNRYWPNSVRQVISTIFLIECTSLLCDPREGREMESVVSVPISGFWLWVLMWNFGESYLPLGGEVGLIILVPLKISCLWDL